MMKLLPLFVAAIYCVSLVCAGETAFLRFVNEIPGSTYTIYTNALTPLKVNYTGITEYVPVPVEDGTGSITVSNVIDQHGNSVSSGLLLTFTNYTTFVLASPSTFTIVKFVENVSNALTNDETQAYVRVINLGSTEEYLTVAGVAGSIAAYQGFLEATSYVAVNPTITTQFRIYDTVNGSYNNPELVLPVQLQAGDAYTVFYFASNTSTSAKIAKLAYDHPASDLFVVHVTTGIQAATTNSATTNAIPTQVTTGGISQEPEFLTTAQVITPNNEEYNSASSVKCSILAMIVMFAAILVC